MEIVRQLATIRRISKLLPIEGADKIELAIVDGWQVVAQKGIYKEGDLVVYFEIDSWIPNTLAPFLTKPGQFPKVYKEVEGQRLKTIKLRGTLSQGLLMPIEKCVEICGCWSSLDEGADATEWLGIMKWEKEIPANLAGTVRGNFPTKIPKTDQERIQNLTKRFEGFKLWTWEVTEKLDGSSCTFYLDAAGEFHVCSRNLDLKYDENNAFWQAALKYNIQSQMEKNGMYDLAIQGELIGPGIQGNQYNLSELEFYVFDIFDAVEGKYIVPAGRRYIVNILQGVKHVPVIGSHFRFNSDDTIEDVLKFSEGNSAINDSVREGLVYKRMVPNEKGDIESFKAINNTWLLGEK